MRATACLALSLALSCSSPEPLERVAQSPRSHEKRPIAVRKVTFGPEQAQHLTLERLKNGKLQTGCVRGRSAAESRLTEQGSVEFGAE